VTFLSIISYEHITYTNKPLTRDTQINCASCWSLCDCASIDNKNKSANTNI
jgi:Pyruvate/2-oxoacid:ferredoxin oxidoreductase delta subunit